MNKQQFHSKIKTLKGLGITQKQIVNKINKKGFMYSYDHFKRCCSKAWKGDCTKVINAFERTFK